MDHIIYSMDIICMNYLFINPMILLLILIISDL